MYIYRALDAVTMSWDNIHLKNVLSSDTYSSHIPDSTQSGSFNSLGQPLWHEPLATCASRVDALRSHGHHAAALRLAVCVVRTMKQQQLDAQRRWQDSQKPPPPRCPSRHSNPPTRCYELRPAQSCSYDTYSQTRPCSSRCVSCPMVGGGGGAGYDRMSSSSGGGGPSSAASSSSACSLSRCGYNNNDSRSGYATGGAGCSSYRCTAFADAPRPNLCTAPRCNSYCTYYDNHPSLRTPSGGPLSGGGGGMFDVGSSSGGVGGSSSGPSSGYRYPERTNSRNGSSGSSGNNGGGGGGSRGGGGGSNHQQTAVLHNSWIEGWVGHPMDPIGCLYDTLTDASIVPDPNVPHSSSASSSLSSFFGTCPALILYHRVLYDAVTWFAEDGDDPRSAGWLCFCGPTTDRRQERRSALEGFEYD